MVRDKWGSAMIMLIAGTRPNFMKVAPIIRAFEERGFKDYMLVHTGQHYDVEMSGAFFKDLKLPEPDVNLEMGSNNHVSLGGMMAELDQLIKERRPDTVVVVGDVDSTLAAALVVAKGNIAKLAHVEAGCRSFDRTMPEEINRVLVDAVSDYCFVACERDSGQLRAEGIPEWKIFLAGDTMVDSLRHHLPRAESYTLSFEDYVLATVHRQANVDDKKTLEGILQALANLSKEVKVVFPIHPRTLDRVVRFGLETLLKKIKPVPPLSYLESIAAMRDAAVVVTDSGSMQTETSVLGVPCLTLRDNTERHNTLGGGGTNKLIGAGGAGILNEVRRVLRQEWPPEPQKWFEWDGNAAGRIVELLGVHHDA